MDPNIASSYQMEQMAALRGMQFPLVSAASFDPSKMKTVEFRPENMQLLEQQAQQSQAQNAGETSQRAILEIPNVPLQVRFKQIKANYFQKFRSATSSISSCLQWRHPC